MKGVAITFEHDHSDLSRLWKKYYSKFLDTNIIKIGDALRHDWGATVRWMNSIQNTAFRDYDIVLFADIDEIIVPDPDKYKDLGEYIEQLDQDVVRCVGYNVIQMEDEPAIDLTKPILEQRKHWSRDVMYDKYVILTRPQLYTSNHHIANPTPVDEDVVMLHLRDIDIDLARERNTKIGANFDMENVKVRRDMATQIPKKYRGII